MIKFATALQLMDFVKENCNTTCRKCGWRREEECKLLAEISNIDHGWIPVLDHIPSKSEQGLPMLLSIDINGLKYIRRGTYMEHAGITARWVVYGDSNQFAKDNVIAWQLEPKPYNKEEENEKTDTAACSDSTADINAGSGTDTHSQPIPSGNRQPDRRRKRRV